MINETTKCILFAWVGLSSLIFVIFFGKKLLTVLFAPIEQQSSDHLINFHARLIRLTLAYSMLLAICLWPGFHYNSSSFFNLGILFYISVSFVIGRLLKIQGSFQSIAMIGIPPLQAAITIEYRK